MTKNARAVLKQFVEAIEQDDISPTMSTGFEKAYQNALAVLQEPDTSPAEAKAVALKPADKDHLTAQPVAYAIFADNGNIRIWSAHKTDLAAVIEATDKQPEPLYTHPAPAQSEADKRDAVRYRFIRDGGEGTDIAVREFDDDGDEVWIHGYPPEELDAAIDAAIAAQKEAGRGV